MAPEVIDLVSDNSEDDVVGRNDASATLRSFGPRKQKNSHDALRDRVHAFSSAQSSHHRWTLPAVGAQVSPLPLERQSNGVTHVNRASVTTDGRVLSEQLGGFPFEPLRRRIQPSSRPYPRQPALERLHDSTSAELSKRINHYDDFHAKENLRYGKPLSLSTQRTSAIKARPAPDWETRNEDLTSGKKHYADLTTKPVLQGADLSIFDIPPDSDFAEDRRSRKRAAPPALAAIVIPPAKRLREDDDVQVTGREAASDQSKRHQRHETARLSALQLEHELNSTLAEAETRPGPVDQPIKHTPQSSDTSAHPPKGSATTIPDSRAAHSSGAGAQYTEEDRALIAKLKEEDGLSWDQIMIYFPGRSKGSLGVLYSTKIKGRYGAAAKRIVAPQPRAQSLHRPSAKVKATDSTAQQTHLHRKREAGPSVRDGFVPWGQVHQRTVNDGELSVGSEEDYEIPHNGGPFSRQDLAYPNPASRILRQRELGIVGSRGWSSSVKRIPDELKNHTLQDYTPTRHYMSTSGDVTCLAWAADDRRFAAGSIAITDDRSMQYNSNLNLLVGESDAAVLQELPEHHVQRPLVMDFNNVNALHSMRESQDRRLFTTVAAVGFAPDGRRLYSAGSDKKLRAYAVGSDTTKAQCLYDVRHSALVDLLSINQHGLVATACHTSADGNVQLFNCGESSYRIVHSLSPSRTDSPSSLPIFPTALKWGATPHHSSYLLAGFSSESNEEERDTAGETALWHAESGHLLNLSTITRNVFDVAWNPSPSSASTAFCVASTPGHGKSSLGRRSVVQCYAPEQSRARQVLELECPAFDINDVMYCPYDDYLIAAGATDGKVYIWDKRFAAKNQNPLHTLMHGDSINVLDHERDRELADTGVRFLSWGATSSRLHSGSSDGVVKAWNPYRSPSDAFVADLATLQTAVMSGAFSSDCRQLLIGEERGRLNLLSLGQDTEDGPAPPSKAFKLNAVEGKPVTEPPFVAATDLVTSQQIEIRDMGALPVRQAVQGPAYQGPYFKPTADDWGEAQEQYQQALDRQNEVHSRPQETANDSEARDADHSVERAQEALLALQTREDSHHGLDLAAIATQKAFRHSCKRRSTQEEDRCRLDCNYLPPEMDEVVPDSRRSEQRIPGALRAFPSRAIDLAALDCNGLFDAGLAAKCKTCPAGREKPSPAQAASCRQRCSNIRAELTGVCQSCAGPVRKQKNKHSQRCERCGFTCFRCSQSVQLVAAGLPNDYNIYCTTCELAWEVDVLGYNLVRNASEEGHAKKTDEGIATLDGEDTQLAYYHSRWQAFPDQT